jgi:aldehyde:ferredoxin oxidoreductase
MSLICKAANALTRKFRTGRQAKQHAERRHRHLPPIANEADLLPTHTSVTARIPTQIDRYVVERTYTQGLPDGCCTAVPSRSARRRSFPHSHRAIQGEIILVDGPEYETIAGEGSNIGVFDPLAIIEMNFYCDTYGVDTISFANSVAFAMECYAEGIIDDSVTGGLKLSWGNAEAALALLNAPGSFGRVVSGGALYRLFVERTALIRSSSTILA